MFFISKMDIYSVVNNKGLALQNWLADFAHKLLPRELDKQAFLLDVGRKMTELDGQYPRTKPLMISKVGVDGGRSLYITVYPKENPEKTIVRFYIHKVIGEYRFCEKVSLELEKGGEQ